MSISEDPTEFVTMIHSGTGGEASATREAFEEVWEECGWRLATDDDVLAGLKKDQLIEMAEGRGIEVDNKMTVADIRDRIKEA